MMSAYERMYTCPQCLLDTWQPIQTCEGCGWVAPIDLPALWHAAVHDGVRVGEMWTCPECAFAFDAEHTDEPDRTARSCPLCEELRLTRVLDAASRALTDSGIVGIYDMFTGLADAITQMAAHIRDLESSVSVGRRDLNAFRVAVGDPPLTALPPSRD